MTNRTTHLLLFGFAFSICVRARAASPGRAARLPALGGGAIVSSFLDRVEKKLGVPYCRRRFMARARP